MPSTTARGGPTLRQLARRPTPRRCEPRASSAAPSLMIQVSIYTHMTDIIACVAVPVSRGTFSPAPGRKPARPTARRTLHLAGPSDDDSGRPDMKGQATGRGSGRDSCGRGLRGRKAAVGVGAAPGGPAMLNVRGQVCADHL